MQQNKEACEGEARVCLFGKEVHVMICMESWVAVKDEAKMMLESNKKRGNNPKGRCNNLLVVNLSKHFLCNLFIINETRAMFLSAFHHSALCNFFSSSSVNSHTNTKHHFHLIFFFTHPLRKNI